MSAPGLKCGGCTACCRSGGVMLAEGDDPARYDVVWRDGRAYLADREDGACGYLGKRGCKIYARRPALCRRFDCRLYFLGKTPEAIDARLRDRPATAATFQAAIERLHTLPLGNR